MRGAALFLTVVLLTGVGCSARTSSTQKAQEESKKIVVARVNSAPITMDAVVIMMNRLAARSQDGSTPERTEEIRKASLDRLILQELAWQQARSRGIAPDPKNIDASIANLRMNLGGKKEYAEFLEKDGVTEKELRARVERSLTVELIFAREVLDKIVIPEEDVRKEYQKEKARYVLPEKINVTDVAFFLKGDKKAARKSAREILKMITADPGKDPWKLVLDGTFIVRTLEVRADRDKELHAAAKKLKLNGLSGIINASDGYHIIKLKQYEPSRQLTFDEVRPTLEQKFRVPEQDKRLAQWEQEMRAGASIEMVGSALKTSKADKETTTP
ncbi:MAG: hypothetical protein A2X56_05305 [Nitrospirae bacterium GWC2_57_13]|nr:MAG: hypothetical protein A2X56_05305 [Nitrospirae bacterium GWC2_57_13]OGW45970.1 MAG: hypothetical protein A2X57_11980 [Nitrospirae bacterium GWD2_57_8]